MAGVSGITPKEPVTYDRYPYEPMDELRTAWINIMQLLNEAKMPRKYQRQLVSVLNNQVLSHVREGIDFSDVTNTICQVESGGMPCGYDKTEVEAAVENDVTPLTELKLTDQVKQKYEKRLTIKEEGNEIFRGRVVILRFTGDIPGITKFMYFVDHVGTYGCHVYKSKAVTTRPITS
ncbi:hypothetical protein EDC96DRAFT_580830 [Choanephora cucurbitarum]|nr:hypothetical protein EDC96DRAFT_580830 [Choanephora cucurbitarum]